MFVALKFEVNFPHPKKNNPKHRVIFYSRKKKKKRWQVREGGQEAIEIFGFGQLWSPDIFWKLVLYIPED